MISNKCLWSTGIADTIGPFPLHVEAYSNHSQFSMLSSYPFAF